MSFRSSLFYIVLFCNLEGALQGYNAVKYRMLRRTVSAVYAEVTVSHKLEAVISGSIL